MHINLAPEKVNTGDYSNASEGVRDAVRRMRDEDERLAALRAAVAAGDEQLERGEGVTYPAERLKQHPQQVLANARTRKNVRSDVTP